MPRLYPLLVGIDEYRTVRPRLRGCVNDVGLAERLLRERVGTDRLAEPLVLCNEKATRGAVIAAFRDYLGQAGEGDTALFWFSGHGSTAPLPKELRYAEESGECQTLVCHDSRSGDVTDLYDKELALLAEEVVTRGALLVSILDSCHSRSGMRGPADEPPEGLPPRLAAPLDAPPLPANLLPELMRAAEDPARPLPGARSDRHIALAACQEHEVANEKRRGGVVHGVFSHAIGRALSRVGPEATYRQVWSHARALVEADYRQQLPALEVVDRDLADHEFLGGALHRPASGVTMRHFGGEWQIDIGTLHGLIHVAGVDTRLAVHGSRPVRAVRVVRADPLRSIVEPLGWDPNPEAQYRMVLTEVPLPPVAVVLPDAPPTDRIIAALRTSPHVRVVPEGSTGEVDKLLRVHLTEAGKVQITSADHAPLAAPVTADEHGVARVAGDLEHIARWLQVRTLTNPQSALSDSVHLEIVPAEPGERTLPDGREALPAGATELHYRRNGTGWTPPSIFVRLRNTGPKRLYCVLLDLTDRFRMDPDLFDGAFVREHWAAVAGRGGPIVMSLPPDRPVEPGRSVTDWFLLLASEEAFSSEAFYLPRLGETTRSAGTLRSATPGLRGVLGRLGLLTARRDGGISPDTVADWTVKVVEIRTSVPEVATP